MTKIVEERHPGESWLQWKLGNLLTIDQDSVKSVGFAWLFKENNSWVLKPRLTGNVSLFYNAIFFIRFNWPLGLFWSVRWSATGKRAYWQSGLGFKLNGRFALLFRIQGDEASAAGVNGPNLNQSTGFTYGTH